MEWFTPPMIIALITMFWTILSVIHKKIYASFAFFITIAISVCLWYCWNHFGQKISDGQECEKRQNSTKEEVKDTDVKDDKTSLSKEVKEIAPKTDEDFEVKPNSLEDVYVIDCPSSYTPEAFSYFIMNTIERSIPEKIDFSGILKSKKNMLLITEEKTSLLLVPKNAFSPQPKQRLHYISLHEFSERLNSCKIGSATTLNNSITTENITMIFVVDFMYEGDR